MKLKMSEGHAVLKDGKPVYVHDDGSEEAFDAPAAMKLARGQAFAASKYVAEKLSIHPELAASAFGGAFRIEKGVLVAYGASGIPVYSHVRPGELANIDEAIEQMVAKYPHRDMILRKGGAAPGQRPGRMTRTEFDAMPPAQRAKYITGGGRISDDASAPPQSTPPAPAGSKTISRAQFDALPPKARAEHCMGGGKITD